MSKARDTQKGPEPFDVLMQRLETIAAALERGDLPLEKSLALFEEGMTLSTQAQRRLDAAELRVRTVTGEVAADGTVPSTPVAIDDDET
jgi:exodeoxyribonuclease VII small subunit